MAAATQTSIWFDLPHEIHLAIIAYALGELRLQWRSRLIAETATGDTNDSSWKSIILVSKHFVDCTDVLAIGLRNGIVDMRSRLKDQFLMQDNLTFALNPDRCCFMDELSTEVGIVLRPSYATIGGCVDFNNLICSPDIQHTDTLLPAPTLSLLFKAFPKLRYIRISAEHVAEATIDNNHPILSVERRQDCITQPRPLTTNLGLTAARKLHYQHHHGFRHTCDRCLKDQVSVDHSGISFHFPMQPDAQAGDWALGTAATESWSPNLIIFNRFYFRDDSSPEPRVLISPPLLHFFEQIRQKNIHLEIAQLFRLNAIETRPEKNAKTQRYRMQRGPRYCGCQLVLEGILNIHDMTLRSDYGGIEWIIPQRLPSETVE